ncbi:MULTISPECIES: ATP synthase F1 subunit epsilon [Asaia]|uniref:ATP synthase epsilon chain n=2 Tax=Asaia bogorensis TaxID=91915 RepID=A0AAN4R237_9PROT|nr:MULTISPECIES: ATP synthase F1 subunit epsilon [Asaia]ETC97479.1 ATP synthase subunit epsilon [Asaia sp. SF2.1]MDL2171235.1 ATP synthase F1 subunit epsilon [Asaia sp. HumB]MDR6183662.1 F-type H+-transporting ATPase subunit epsilon [Asaia bogorensis NBRC 16594]CDG40238.1 ATP synthase epsilon chain [Asaia bogorensis]BAT18496.1 ATP synthase F1 subunit epsilon [Asaia bogorensis NBRC 16594]
MPVQVEIISPEKLLFRKEVEMAVIPGEEGDIAAMPDHAPIMLLLRGGVVSLYEGGVVTERFFVSGGFADITADRCTILADEALPIKDIVLTEAESRLETLELQLTNVAADDLADIERISRKIQSTRAAIEAAEAAHPIY